jgi:hypothetical protein
MRDRVNSMVKMREAFRPFAPSVSLEQVHAPHGVVGEVLLNVGKTGHGLALREVFPVRQLRVPQDRRSMAQRAGDLACRVELDELPVQPYCLLERKHRRLTARYDYGVEPRNVGC